MTKYNIGDIISKRIERLATWLNDLGIDVNIDEFESRIRIQKLAYLLGKLLNEDLYLDFRFHTRGPYSKELEIEYYAAKTDFNYAHSKLSGREAEEITRLKLLGVSSFSAEDLEIMASLFYLEKEEHLDEEAAIKELEKRKPYFKLGQIIRSLSLLKDFMLTAEEKKRLTRLLEKEMMPFENASVSDFTRAA